MDTCLHHYVLFYSIPLYSIPSYTANSYTAGVRDDNDMYHDVMYHDECEVLPRRGVAFQSPEALAILSALQVGLHTTIKVSG